MTVTGFGSSELEDILKPLAAAQDRTLHGETSVQSGFYFRSDHFNFAKAGVPALYADGGEDLREGGVEAGRKAAADYGANRYHGPKGRVRRRHLEAGRHRRRPAADVRRGQGTGRWRSFPNWYAGNPFKAARDAMMKDKVPAK